MIKLRCKILWPSHQREEDWVGRREKCWVEVRKPAAGQCTKVTPVRYGRAFMRMDGDVRCRSDCQLAFVTLLTEIFGVYFYI